MKNFYITLIGVSLFFGSALLTADNESEVENNNTIDNIVIDRNFIFTLPKRLDKTYV